MTEGEWMQLIAVMGEDPEERKRKGMKLSEFLGI